MPHCSPYIVVAFCLIAHSFANNDIAWGDVSPNGEMVTRTLDIPVATARGYENLYISDPMDSHDWSQVEVVMHSVRSELKAASAHTTRLVKLQADLKQIYTVLPKNKDGYLNNGTARYALHRYFNERHAWSIKGLQPAGAAWQATMSVTPDVKDITKYMVPAYMQHLILQQTGKTSFDLEGLSIMAATIEHLIHAEIIATVHSVYTTLELPIPGSRTDHEVREILETYAMMHAFGVNLDVSVREDVQRAKAHLQKVHSSWPSLVAFTWQVKTEMFAKSNLNFDEIVQVVARFGERYVKWQGQDCSRAKKYLVALPSYQKGSVKLREVEKSTANGRRELFGESVSDLEKLGVLVGTKGPKPDFIIANYLNSQNMCLSTASYYTACCVNECEGLLARLEREVLAPKVKPEELARVVKKLPGANIAESLLEEIPRLATQGSGLVPLHSRALAKWMHRAFPLECPAPSDQIITNPKTPDEWMGASGKEVAKLEEMMAEIAEVLNRYTTMGKSSRTDTVAEDETVPDSSGDVFRIAPQTGTATKKKATQHWDLLSVMAVLAAIASVFGLGMKTAQTILVAIGRDKKKAENFEDSASFA
jgi:hypothetical protein